MAEVTDSADHGFRLLEIDWNGRTYRLAMNQLGANDSAMVRKQVGISLRAVMAGLTDDDDADLDLVAALIWLARRQAGEAQLKYAQVTRTMSYAQAHTLAVRQLGPDGEPLELDDDGNVIDEVELADDEGPIAGN